MQDVIAYLDCHSGISGDMFLGALLDLDAGFSLDFLRTALAGLPLQGYALRLEPFQDKGILGSRFDVVLSEQDTHFPHMRSLSDIVALLHASTLSPKVREIALSIFQCLAKAEATIHGTNVETVHFHEVGAIDAIIDITGAAIALEALGITQLYASSLPLSSGHVQTAHGLLPVPAPATLEILRQVPAHWKPSPAEGEMVTPTGAAILATQARFQTPAIFIERVGYGFGRKQFPWPNCLRVCLGRAGKANQQSESADVDWVAVIESNIDNMTGELLGGLMDKLFSAGALDVNYTPIQMKKNRPAVMLTVICRVEEGTALSELLLSESSTLGVRISQVQRIKAQRVFERIETPFGPISMKIKRLGDRIISATPEYEDCQRIALEKGIPLEDVYDVARRVIK
ncbi:MAG TPA: nickel pincer cofactor biosynthesis protein LarC [Ktedonobacteraceae bacterium]|nr:nickel pincer cofactor biosynthesis protein LarC [Ktedonobacteraceae bacterium]